MRFYSQGLVLIICAGVKLFFATVPLIAQTDTTLLGKIVVTPLQEADGVQVIDSVHLSMANGGSLADLIGVMGPYIVKNYGPGQLSSPAFRGANAAQTPVVWNGLRINNLMLAQSDLSQIPAGIINSGGILFGPGTLRYASGAAGGVISIRSELPEDTGLRVQLELQGGSFGYLSGNGMVSFSTPRVTSATRVYRSGCENRFPYPDNYNSTAPYPTVLRTNASWREEGLMQQLGFTTVSGVATTLHLWLFHKFNQVPYPLQQPQGQYRQEQEEEGLRLVLDNRYRIKGPYVFTHLAGYQQGSMHYVEERSATDALHRTMSFQESISASGHVLGNWVTLQGEWEWQGVHTLYYQKPAQRMIAAGLAEVSGKIVKKLKYRLISRMEWVTETGFDWMPSAILTFSPDLRERHRISARFIRDRRLPGLNDLYWYPGGNPMLDPERSIGTELQYVASQLRWKGLFLTPEITFFRQTIEDKITWLPDTGALWKAFNQGIVRMQGITSSLKVLGEIGLMEIMATVSYQYCQVSPLKENNRTEGTQLIYQPYHSGLITASVQHKGITCIWNSGFTGKRYTNADNNAWLNGYSVSGIRLNYLILTKTKVQPSLTIAVDNIFDRHYQAIAWYPMPGRNFRVGVSIDFKQGRKISS